MGGLPLEVATFPRVGTNLLYLLSPKLPEIIYYTMVEMEVAYDMDSKW